MNNNLYNKLDNLTKYFSDLFPECKESISNKISEIKSDNIQSIQIILNSRTIYHYITELDKTITSNLDSINELNINNLYELRCEINNNDCIISLSTKDYVEQIMAELNDYIDMI